MQYTAEECYSIITLHLVFNLHADTWTCSPAVTYHLYYFEVLFILHIAFFIFTTIMQTNPILHNIVLLYLRDFYLPLFLQSQFSHVEIAFFHCIQNDKPNDNII